MIRCRFHFDQKALPEFLHVLVQRGNAQYLCDQDIHLRASRSYLCDKYATCWIGMPKSLLPYIGDCIWSSVFACWMLGEKYFMIIFLLIWSNLPLGNHFVIFIEWTFFQAFAVWQIFIIVIEISCHFSSSFPAISQFLARCKFSIFYVSKVDWEL